MISGAILLGASLGVGPFHAASPAMDDAADPAYDDGWQPNDDGGCGWRGASGGCSPRAPPGRAFSSGARLPTGTAGGPPGRSCGSASSTGVTPRCPGTRSSTPLPLPSRGALWRWRWCAGWPVVAPAPALLGLRRGSETGQDGSRCSSSPRRSAPCGPASTASPGSCDFGPSRSSGTPRLSPSATRSAHVGADRFRCCCACESSSSRSIRSVRRSSICSHDATAGGRRDRTERRCRPAL